MDRYSRPCGDFAWNIRSFCFQGKQAGAHNKQSERRIAEIAKDIYERGGVKFVTEALDDQVSKKSLGLLDGADAGIPCVRPKDTIRTEEKTLDRASLYAVQTPQGFRLSVLKKAYEKAIKASGNPMRTIIDDAEVTDKDKTRAKKLGEVSFIKSDWFLLIVSLLLTFDLINPDQCQPHQEYYQ